MKKTKQQQQRIDYFAGLAMQSLLLVHKEHFDKLDEPQDELEMVLYDITSSAVWAANIIVEQLDKDNNEQ